jgi:hypothetical protein
MAKDCYKLNVYVYLGDGDQRHRIEIVPTEGRRVINAFIFLEFGSCIHIDM